jgi:hypothetical protein
LSDGLNAFELEELSVPRAVTLPVAGRQEMFRTFATVALIASFLA